VPFVFGVKREISCKIESFGEKPASPRRTNSRRSDKAREASVGDIAQMESRVNGVESNWGDEVAEIIWFNTLSSAT